MRAREQRQQRRKHPDPVMLRKYHKVVRNNLELS